MAVEVRNGHGQVWPGAVCWGKAWLIYLKIQEVYMSDVVEMTPKKKSLLRIH